MSKLQIVLSIIGLCLMLASCSNDDDQIFESCKISDCNQTPMSRSLLSNDDLTDVVVYGYTTCENQKNMKLLFNKDLAAATGLQAGGVYVTRYEKYTITIPLSNQIFFENEDNPRCGLKSMSDPANGGYISMNRGYNEVSQNERSVVLECYLIHVISDLSGRSLNIYYPCKPDQIEWRGLLYNL